MESNDVKELTKKQELNNHIVCMRKCVRQAKVHVIRKLTREVKKLRDRKGSEEIQLKSKRKADRLYLEITTIKHLKEDKVSISALRNTLKLEEILQNPKSTIEEKSTARLIHHPSINTQVQNYRKNNPNWKLQIPVLLEKNPVKLKKAQKKEAEKEKKKQENKNNIIKSTNIDNKLLENKVKIEGEDNDDDANKVVTNEESTDEENEINSSDDEDNLEINLNESSDEGIDSEDIEQEDEEIEKPIVTKINKNVEKSKPNSKNNNQQTKEDTTKKEPLLLNKTEGTIKVQVIKDWSEFEVEETSHQKNKSEISSSLASNNDKVVKKPKSSFFLGCFDNTTNKDNKEKQVQQHYNDNLNRRARRGNVPIKKSQRDPRQDNFNTPNRNNNNKWGVQNTKSGDKFNSSNNQRPPRYFDKNSTSSSSFNDQQGKSNLLQPDYLKKNREAPKPGPPEKLHPSWEAKKRQSVILPSFQGKKIKFDD